MGKLWGVALGDAVNYELFSSYVWWLPDFAMPRETM
ncbi:MAG: hypothetical protein AVDCRST_MAG85-3088 [uncultured Solirubrobacteraceae bacterium]|uniref:Uncharacterized protein n=1 Tax=uncultured Solirubrobacteraceae bacterium TaxID=1162706 RepID=A0A6J4TJL0_9ACTN|nr:MAG: hypothetical protein AVDCRST_MAG85-3088 [uncultured Solirubrobacteraceae bacterium]